MSSDGSSVWTTHFDADTVSEIRVLPVVLVTGLADTHLGLAPVTGSLGGPWPAGGCAGVGDMAALCEKLQAQGFAVYVPSSSARASDDDVITNSESVSINAASLAGYLASVVRDPALLVGHSMGGLFSRDAIGHDGATAAGLFTIGTPFDGSFGADLDAAAANLPKCPYVCTSLRAIAEAARAYLGAAAVADLTSVARGADNLTLGPTGVQTWTIAGTACHPFANDPSGYYSPNDGIVGLSSALGKTANLGPTTTLLEGDYHSGFTTNFAHCGTHLLELSDPNVATAVITAAQSLAGGLAADARARAESAHVATGLASGKPARVVIHLQSVAVRSLKPGSPLQIAAGTSLLSPSAFTLACGGRPLQALPLLGGSGAFGLPPGAIPCQRATLSAARAVRVIFGSDAARATATITSGRKSAFTITVAARRPIKRLTLTRGGHTVTLKQYHHGRRAIRVTVTAAQAAGLTLTATIHHVRYAATISALG